MSATTTTSSTSNRSGNGNDINEMNNEIVDCERTEQFVVRALSVASQARKHTVAMQHEREKLRADVSGTAQRMTSASGGGAADDVDVNCDVNCDVDNVDTLDGGGDELDCWIREHNQATFGQNPLVAGVETETETTTESMHHAHEVNRNQTAAAGPNGETILMTENKEEVGSLEPGSNWKSGTCDYAIDSHITSKRCLMHIDAQVKAGAAFEIQVRHPSEQHEQGTHQLSNANEYGIVLVTGGGGGPAEDADAPSCVVSLYVRFGLDTSTASSMNESAVSASMAETCVVEMRQGVSGRVLGQVDISGRLQQQRQRGRTTTEDSAFSADRVVELRLEVSRDGSHVSGHISSQMCFVLVGSSKLDKSQVTRVGLMLPESLESTTSQITQFQVLAIAPDRAEWNGSDEASPDSITCTASVANENGSSDLGALMANMYLAPSLSEADMADVSAMLATARPPAAAPGAIALPFNASGAAEMAILASNQQRSPFAFDPNQLAGYPAEESQIGGTPRYGEVFNDYSSIDEAEVVGVGGGGGGGMQPLSQWTLSENMDAEATARLHELLGGVDGEE